MDAESLLVAAILALATLPLALFLARSRPAATRVGAFAVWALFASVLTWAAQEYPPSHRPPVTDQPIESRADGYVSSKACKSCHPDQYGSWYARRGNEVWVEMQELEGDSAGVVGHTETDRVWKQIVQTTGSHEEQFYWVASGESRRLSLLPIMYRLLDEQRWAPLDGCCISAQNIVQESGTGRWNRICNRCHATHGMPRIRSESEMDTHVAELGIACEACHGPAQEHVALNQDPRRRYASYASDAADPSIVDPQDLDQVRSSQVCGQCHGVNLFKTQEDRVAWHENGFRYRPGDDLAALMSIKKTGDDKFWSDGMIRVSGREHNGLVESPCYRAGEMTCLSCHVMHKTADDPRSMLEWANDLLKPGMEGDAACTQCHADIAAVGSAHTNHADDSSGAQCMNCHMPYTTYGLLKAIRSHTVSSPSVQESLATGRPNACNQCHIDRTFAWAAERLEAWYGIAPPQLGGDERNVAAGPLWTLKGDAGQRALMAWTYGWDAARTASGTDWMTPYMTVLMSDPYRAVRYISARSFEQQPEARLIEYDFTGDPEELARAIEPAYNKWMQLADSRDRDDSLLIGADGKLDTIAVDRLLDVRDLRRIILNE